MAKTRCGDDDVGRLQPADADRLAAIGVAHVINLALEDHPEALPDESSLLERLGIAYTHIPIPFDRPEEDHYRRFKEALTAGGSVHVHCIMNYRVSAFFYRLNRERGMAESEASAILHQQWAPEESQDSLAKVWAEFMARKPVGAATASG